MEEQRKIEEEQRKKEEEEFRQKLILATAPGTRYIGTISHGDERQRLRLVFTEQKHFLIRAEASNPDIPTEKQTFTGELVFDPKPEKGKPDVAYPIVLSPIGEQDFSSYPLEFRTKVWNFYRYEGSLKLRLTDIGLEGEAHIWSNYIIRLQRGDIKVKPGEGVTIPPIQDKKERVRRTRTF
jgi:hypothetical protein